MGHLNKGENDKFATAIFFFLRGDPYSKAKAITSGCRCNLGDGEGLQIPCKLKLVGHQSLSTYCKMNLSDWKKFKLRNYDAKYIFFFISWVFSALGSLYRDIFGSRGRKYGL